MSTKVDQPSAVEPRTIKMSGTTSSGTSTSGSKVSMFAAKSGFVIPKNKLSGSLVPIFRGGKKPEGSDAAKEESTKQVQRKTKWGPDLTQDAAVRNGRALAYQTRVDQITQQLKLGNLEYGAKKVSPSSQHLEYESSSHQYDSEESELLELEKREAIGEILKLNPSYKAPPDYKPLLKEARVPIPVKEYPGYNFVGLIFGPGSDTQKRLEKETGVKIQVQGTKADTAEKVEISPSDGNEIHGTYEELYVHVSADTFEKVDAAVALIEMLVTSVSGNLTAVSTTSSSVSGEKVNVLPQSEGAATPYMVPTVVVNQGVMQPVMGPTQTRPQGQPQYPGPWFSMGPPQAPMPSPSGFIPTPNTSAPILGGPFNPSNMPSLFGPRPTLGSGFNSIFQNPSLVHPRTQPPTQSFQHPYMPQTQPGPPRIHPMLAPQPSSAQPTTLAPLSFTASQPSPTGLPPNPRQLMPSLPQPMSNVPPGLLPDWPSTPAGSFKGWSTSSMAQMVPPQGPRLVHQPSFMSAAPPSNIAGANMVSPMTFPSQASSLPLSSAPMNLPAAQIFSSVPPHQVGYTPASSVSLRPTHIPAPAPTSIQSSSAFAPVLSTTQPQPLQSEIPSSVSVSIPNFTPLKPPTLTTPRLQHRSSGDFTFQPHRPQNLSSQPVPSASSQPATQNILPPNPLVQPRPSPHAAPFQLAIHSSTLQPVMQGFLRPPVPNQMGQPPNQISAANFAGNTTPVSVPPRLPAFSSANNFAPTTRNPHMGPRNFSPAPPAPNMAGPFPPRPGNAMQNYPAPAARPEVLMPPNQQFRNNISFASGKPTPNPSGGQQIYDPFSPTSVSIAAQQPGGNRAVRRQENDPEYDDLMESVGVK